MGQLERAIKWQEIEGTLSNFIKFILDHYAIQLDISLIEMGAGKNLVSLEIEKHTI